MLWFPAELDIRPVIQNGSVPFTYKPKSLQNATVLLFLSRTNILLFLGRQANHKLKFSVATRLAMVCY